jgi:hypothetical protein
MPVWPDDLFEFAFIHNLDGRLDDMAQLAEAENWDYGRTVSDTSKPILRNYLRYTYTRLAEESKIFLSDNGEASCFNTGLVTPGQEAIFALFSRNQVPERQPWFLQSWVRAGEHHLNRFDSLPPMAHYFDDPASLVFDSRKELRVNVDHIIEDNRERFPEKFKEMGQHVLAALLQGTIEQAKQRVSRNYKTAIPQYYRGRIQLLLPLCLSEPKLADLALVVENMGNFYRASTCLTLDMAFNNARQLARPDLDWLQP